MRSIRRPEMRFAFAALFVALFLTACRNPYPGPRFRGAGARQPHYGGTVTFAFDTDVRSLDPHIAYDEISGAGVHFVFDTLVDYAPGTGDIAPSLAERWEIAEDGRLFTFHLRSGVRFHNGRVMTADDVRQSFERMLDPRAIPSPGTSFYHLLDGFDEFQSHAVPHVRGIAVLDPLTIQFRLTQPDQTFLNAMALPFAAPVPMEAVRAEGRDRFAQEPVGTGPFYVERWEMGSRIVFRRNPHYWRAGHPYLDRIVLETGIARHLQFMRFQRGDIDYAHVGSIITADHVWLHQQASWAPYIEDSPDVAMYGVAMNVEVPPWNNVHLRRAVTFAIDREGMCRARNNRIRPLGGLYPPGLPGYDPNVEGAQHFDMQRAREEMALAGYADGLPGEQELWIAEGDGAAYYGQLVQADLRRIGIRIRLHQSSFAVFLENTERRHAVGLSMSAWSQDFPDPSNFIDTLVHSRSIQPENSQNASFYSNPQLDALLDRARIEGDRPRRIGMYQEAERLLLRDAPWAFLYYPVKTQVRQPYLQGLVASPVWAHELRDVWLDLPRQRFAQREREVRSQWAGLASFAMPWSAR